MSYSLFLDDCRMPHQVNWVRIPDVEYEIVRSYEDFVAKIEKKGLPEFVSFDHDLCVEHYKQMADLFYKKNVVVFLLCCFCLYVAEHHY